MSPQIKSDDLIRFGEEICLSFPIAAAGTEAMDEQDGSAVTTDFVIQVNVVNLLFVT